MLRLGCFFLLCGLWCWTDASWGQSIAQQNPQLSVGVYNDAVIPGNTLLRAEAKASAIYRRAGIELRWLNSPGSPAELSLRIIPKSRTLPNEVFGAAFLDSDGFGQQADIFYANISHLSAVWSRNQAEVLGFVMAHEIGHLLLGSNSHSATGIMRLHWDEQQLHLASLNQLTFDRKEIQRIHQRLQNRERDFARNQFKGAVLADNNP